MKNSGFKIKFWGVRGSYPVAGRHFLKYGGNTSCVEVQTGSQRIILDCGTGIIPLGDKIFGEHISSSDNIFEREPIKITLLLSHIHQDHIQGLNFFKPLNVMPAKLNIFGYSGFNMKLNEALSELVFGKSFPVNLYDIKADCNITDIAETNAVILNNNTEPELKRITRLEDTIPAGDETIITFMKSNAHPNYGVMCFKISYKGKSIVYATDTECYRGGAKKLELFAKDTDLIIHDSQYTTEDYLSNPAPKQGFGHSTFEMADETAKNTNAKRLVFFHYDPSYNDDKLAEFEKIYKKENKNSIFAKEGMEIWI